ncbi:MAG: UDP-N-acetylglucosamine--N-acetylmuramyl-(pentapeptide) pyrophosphoryl-undecaprenol N-acetylglucosamine transferase [Lentisphaeria bacterium]|nr:UDP-N-acetylglucosamine--N-acetylmuramyl-(pentapeptide) pyrophosphoryl-undecaprenol N-acetylglucosamine transferase [Lentisphaeria bacterium]
MTDIKKAVAISCGGTGGHFYPGLAIAHAAREQGADVLLLISGHHKEHQIKVANEHGFKAIPMDAMRLPRTPIQLIKFPFSMCKNAFACKTQLKANQIKSFLAMGSFASVPLALGARLAGLPIHLHEGNAVVGQANRFVAKFAKHISLSMPLVIPLKEKLKQEVHGMPLRPQLCEAYENPGKMPEDLTQFDKTKPILFVFGGSQGARSLNETMKSALTEWPEELKEVQVIHFYGQSLVDGLEESYIGSGLKYLLKKGDPNIHHFYNLCSHVICRAGASTILELALFGKAPLLIPFPLAKENHQLRNAELMVKENAAWLIEEHNFSIDDIYAHLANKEQSQRNQNIQKFGTTDAAKQVAKGFF